MPSLEFLKLEVRIFDYDVLKSRILDIKKSLSTLLLPTSKPSISGFTLIELLVAISILAIVSAVGFVTYQNAQIAGRDTKRKDDMRQVQTALEIFFQSQNPHFYPATGWGALSTALTSGPGFINEVPDPPSADPSFAYVYTSAGTCGTGTCAYHLCARLENNSEPLSDPGPPPATPATGVGVITGGGDCAGSGARYLHLANP